MIIPDWERTPAVVDSWPFDWSVPGPAFDDHCGCWRGAPCRLESEADA